MLRISKGKGFTVVELIVAMTILMILTAVAVPVVRVTIQRNKERELRHDLWEMRDAIDRYKDAADRGAFQIKVDSQGYPPDLETLVKGVDSNGKKIRFLRQNSDRPNDRQDRMGAALDAGRARFGLMGRAKRFRRLYQVGRHRLSTARNIRRGSLLARIGKFMSGAPDNADSH